MEHQVGTKIVWDKKLTKKGNFVYWEGPLMSHFVEESTGNNYIFDWCDVDDICNRWLVYNPNDVNLLLYLNQEINTYDLIMSCDEYYLIDIDNDIKFVNCFKLNKDEIPDDYLPTNESLSDNYEVYYDKYFYELRNSFK